MAHELGLEADSIAALQAQRTEREQDSNRALALEIQRRLIAIANGQAGSELERVGAVALLTQMSGASGDPFVDARLRELYTARYVQEFSARGCALVPETMSEPKHPDGAASAAEEAGREQRFISRGNGHHEVGDAQRSALNNALHSGIEKVIGRLTCDFERQTDVFVHLLEQCSTWNDRRENELRAELLYKLGMRRRASFQIAESTRLFEQRAALYQRELEELKQQNAGIERLIDEVKDDELRRDVLRAKLSYGDNGAAAIPFPTAYDLRLARGISSDKMLVVGRTRCWFRSACATLWSGPRSDLRRSEDFRYFSRDIPEQAWALALLGGSPKLHARLRFGLSFEPTSDIPTFAELSAKEVETVSPAATPRLSVFFGAREVHQIDARPLPAAPPLEAIGLSISAEQVALSTLVLSSNGLHIQIGEYSTFNLPRTGTFEVVVRREAEHFMVVLDGQRTGFHAPLPELGYVGLVIEGPGFVRLIRPEFVKTEVESD